METLRSRLITLVAIGQFVALALFPWRLTVGTGVALAVLAALCVFLGWLLLGRKPWGVTLTVFVQGLNVVIRIITVFSNVYDEATGVNLPLLVTYILSSAVSLVILGYIDRPEVRLQFGF